MTVPGPNHDAPFRGLTPLQERFVREYVRCGSAKRAAVLAGYAVRSAKQIGHTLLKQKHIKAAIEQLHRAGQSEPEAMTPEWALQQLLDETRDPNPRVRLDAKKAVAQAIGALSQANRAPEECPRCEQGRKFGTMSAEDLQLFIHGITRDRVMAMSGPEFEVWAGKAREEVEAAIRAAAGLRGRPGAYPVAGQESDLPVFTPVAELPSPSQE